MTKNLKEMLNNIPIPDDLDERIELGFKDARAEINMKKNRFKKSFISIAASLAIILTSVGLIGIDKVQAAIRQVLQYIPGYNIVLESDEGNIFVLKDKVYYEDGDIYVKINAAAKLKDKINISLESNYEPIEDTEILLKDEEDKVFSTSAWMRAGGGEFWQGDYYFELEGDYKNYSLLIGDMEVAFSLEKSTQLEDFFQLGNHASDKGIDIVAIKKPLENRLMISLLYQSEERTILDYPFERALSGVSWDNQPLQVDKSMYIVDNEGNKTYPTIPSSFGSLMSDFYFDIEDKEGLKLVLPYVRVEDYNLKSKKVKIKTPKDGESIAIDKQVTLGDFEIKVFDVKRHGDEILVSVESSSLPDEYLDEVRIGGINGYGYGPNEETGHMEISINAEDVGRSFSIFFYKPVSLLVGDWVIDLD